MSQERQGGTGPRRLFAANELQGKFAYLNFPEETYNFDRDTE